LAIDVPVIITEGEFKTLALWRLANHDSPKAALRALRCKWKLAMQF
jgi:hypothetical protein